MIFGKIETDGLFQIGLGHHEVVDSLTLAEFRLGKGQLRVIEIGERALTYIERLGSNVISLLGDIHSIRSGIIAVHVGFHSIEILTDGNSELSLGVNHLQIHLVSLHLCLAYLAVTFAA